MVEDPAPDLGPVPISLLPPGAPPPGVVPPAPVEVPVPEDPRLGKVPVSVDRPPEPSSAQPETNGKVMSEAAIAPRRVIFRFIDVLSVELQGIRPADPLAGARWDGLQSRRRQ
jgi:hypothetical protein